MGIHRNIPISSQCAPGNLFCHRGFANHKHIFPHGCIPKLLQFSIVQFFFGIGGTPAAENAVGHIQGIQTRFGIDLQHTGTGICEGIGCHLATVHKAGLIHHLVVGFVVEVIAAQTVAHVHIHYPPRSQNGFLIRVFEAGEQLCNFLNPLRGGKFISTEHRGANPASGGYKDFRVIVFDKALEHFLGHTGGHEFIPGRIVHDIHQFFHGDILVNRNISAINQQWHTDGNAPQDGNRIVFQFLLFLPILQTLFLFRCALILWLPFNALQFFVFFIRKALSVDVDLFGLGSRFGCTDYLF